MMFQRSAAILAASLFLTTSSVAQTSAGEGLQIAGSLDLRQYCGSFPAIHTFLDGSSIVFDGREIQRRSADGTLLRHYGSLSFDVFPTFMKVTPDGAMAYFGDSSTGNIRSLDLVSGQMLILGTLMFNYDLAFDVVPGLAYVAASAFGSATNSIFRIDLASGIMTQVADIGGFSGPIEVDTSGNLYTAVLPGSFPFPAGGTSIVLFSATDLTSGQILTDELNGTSHSGGFNSLSSSDYDPATDSLVVIETNTGMTGSESVVWKLDPAGSRAFEVARTGGYTSGCQFNDAGTGAYFSQYQNPSTSVRFSYRECSTTTDWRIWNVAPARPVAFFSGPMTGVTGPASIEIGGGVPNGFASLWLCRSGQQLPNEIFVQIGATYPVALSATLGSFSRRLPPMALNANGYGRVDFTQTPALAGAILFQWVAFDASMTPVGTSTYAVN